MVTLESFSLESLTEAKRRRFAICDALQRRTGRQLIFARSDALELLAVEQPIEPDRERLRTEMDIVVDSRSKRSKLNGVRTLVWNGNIISTEVGRNVECLDAVSAWAHYAGILSLEELIVLADSMMRRDRRLCRAEPEDFRTYLDHAGQFLGVRNCKRALALMRPNTDSSQETRTRLALLRYGLPEPDVNHPVRIGGGRTIWLDMAYGELRIAIEYDGGYHRFSGEQVLRDDARRRALEAFGWIYVKVTKLDLANADSEEALAQIIASKIEMVLGVPVPLVPRMTDRQICDARRGKKTPLWHSIPREHWIAPWARA